MSCSRCHDDGCSGVTYRECFVRELSDRKLRAEADLSALKERFEHEVSSRCLKLQLRADQADMAVASIATDLATAERLLASWRPVVEAAERYVRADNDEVSDDQLVEMGRELARAVDSTLKSRATSAIAQAAAIRPQLPMCAARDCDNRIDPRWLGRCARTGATVQTCDGHGGRDDIEVRDEVAAEIRPPEPGPSQESLAEAVMVAAKGQPEAGPFRTPDEFVGWVKTLSPLPTSVMATATPPNTPQLTETDRAKMDAWLAEQSRNGYRKLTYVGKETTVDDVYRWLSVMTFQRDHLMATRADRTAEALASVDLLKTQIEMTVAATVERIASWVEGDKSSEADRLCNTHYLAKQIRAGAWRRK